MNPIRTRRPRTEPRRPVSAPVPRAGGRVGGANRRGVRSRLAGTPRDAGMATAEYAIVLIAAVGFAGLLVVILSSGEVREMLLSLVRGALSV